MLNIHGTQRDHSSALDSRKTPLWAAATRAGKRALTPAKLPAPPPPFGALLGASSLLVAVLYVAGFAYRWAYYYNFGAQHIVFSLSFPSILITAMELVKQPGNLLLSFLVILCPLILLNSVVGHITQAGRSAESTPLNKGARVCTRLLALDSPLVVDSLRAALLLYTTYMLSSQAGYAAFKQHSVNSPGNPLPAVTVIFGANQEKGTGPLSCGAQKDSMTQLIGDAEELRLVQEAYRTCSIGDTKWRLLYRDHESIIIFASEVAGSGRRPLTLVLPTSATTYVLTE